jgi:hypothetical protein
MANIPSSRKPQTNGEHTVALTEGDGEMRELAGSAANFALIESDKGLVGIAEIILVCSEPRYSVDLSGGLVRSRAVEDWRFGMTAKSLRDMAKIFTEHAANLEKLEQTVAAFAKNPAAATAA